MAVPSSGLLCLKGFGLEKICNSYTSLCSIGTVGMKGVTIGGQFGATCTFPATNTASPSFPGGSAPYCFSGWYGYDHDAVAAGWSAGSAINVARAGMSPGGTTGNAITVAMGNRRTNSANFATNYNNTREYNGSSWSNAGATPFNSCAAAGAGAQNSMISFAATKGVAGAFGQYGGTRDTIEYSGFNWSSGGNLPGYAFDMSGWGNTQNSAAGTGGYTFYSYAPFGIYTGFPTGATYEYNGSSWSNSGNVLGYFRRAASFGSQNSAAVTGDFSGNYANATTKEYNGSTWSNSGGAIGSGRFGANAGGNSVNSGVLAFGSPCNLFNAANCANVDNCTRCANAMLYNGSSWSTSCNSSCCRQFGAGAGCKTLFTVTGGCETFPITNTQEYIS